MMRAQKGVRSRALTPGEWVLMYHNAALSVKEPGDEFLLAEVHQLEHAEDLLRKFVKFRQCLSKFPMHSTARETSGRHYRGKIRQTGYQTWEAWITYTPNAKKTLDQFIFERTGKKV